MKKVYDFVKNLSIINLGLLMTVVIVIVMAIMVITQSCYYECIALWPKSILLVAVQITLEVVCFIINKLETRKERA